MLRDNASNRSRATGAKRSPGLESADAGKRTGWRATVLPICSCRTANDGPRKFRARRSRRAFASGTLCDPRLDTSVVLDLSLLVMAGGRDLVGGKKERKKNRGYEASEVVLGEWTDEYRRDGLTYVTAEGKRKG